MEEKFRREEQPLLCDVTVSDEEVVAWRAERRRGGRAASKMKGAANIIHRWPDDLLSTSKFTCCIVVLAVLFIFIVVYLIVMLLSISSSDHYRFRSGLMNTALIKNENFESEKYKVICPVIMNDEEMFNISNYISSLNNLNEKYPYYEYKLLILVNDTVAFGKENNESAMRLILKHEDILKSEDKHHLSKICVETIMLSEYMNKSPLTKDWKVLNSVILPLLTRAISIWNNGGITFDLNEFIIGNGSRFEKEIDNVLKYFAHKEIKAVLSDNRDKPEVTGTSDTHLNMKSFDDKKNVFPKKIFNNIRDIIEDLERVQYNDTSKEILKSEESKLISSKTDEPLNELIFRNDAASTKPKFDLKLSKYYPNSTMLPSFLKYWFKFDELFNMYRSKKGEVNSSSAEVYLKPKNITSLTQGQFAQAINKNHSKNFTNERTTNKQIITKKDKSNVRNPYYFRTLSKMPSLDPIKQTTSIKSYRNTRSNEINDIFLLELNINGKLFATKTPCHAFVGELFTTINKHPTVDSPAKLIDIALKLFCNAKRNPKCAGIHLLI